MFCIGLPTEKKPSILAKNKSRTWVCASHEEKADLPLEFYKEYGKRSEVATLIYIDDTGEVSEFQINE